MIFAAVHIISVAFRAVKPVNVSKNPKLDILLSTNLKRAPVLMRQKRTDPLLDHIVDSERSLEVYRDVGEWDTRNHQYLLGQHSHPLLNGEPLHHSAMIF